MRTRTAFPLLIIGLLIGSFASAQVKIGDNPQTINPASVLELESTERVLVITRVDSIQMSNIVPNRGALVYNTSADCVFYYNGTDWINLCGDGAVGGLTTDPIVNPQSTIVITPTPTGGNIEVAESSINSRQIIDGGINGIDIQNGSIGRGKLQNSSVDRTKLAENSVGPFAIDNDSVDLADFNNITGFIRDTDLISGDADNAIVAGGDGGAYYDDSVLQTAVAANTAGIAADGDTDDTNEIQLLTLSGNSIQIEDGNTIDLTPILSDGGTDDQNLTLTGNILEIEDGNTVDFTPILASGGSDDQTLTLTGNIVGIEDGNTIDLTPILGSGGADDQNLTLTGNILEIENGNTVDFTPLLGGGGGVANQNLDQVLTQGNDGGTALIKNIANPVDGQDAATKSYVDAAITTGGGGLADGTILVGDATGAAAQVLLSGDATLDNVGAITISNEAVGSDQIEDATISLADLNANGATTDGDIMQWDTTANAGAGGWVVTSNSSGGGNQTAAEVPVTTNPTNYIAATQDVEAHLLGIDAALGTGSSGGGNQNLGQVLTQGNDGGAVLIKNIGNPQDDQDAATKSYVDAAIITGGSGLANGNILVGDITGAAAQVLLSGDATMDNTGALTITDDVINSLKILNGEVQTDDIADTNVTEAKIAPGEANQILRTNSGGSAVEWVDFPTGTVGGGTVLTDGITITGDGVGISLSVQDGGIITGKIAGANVTPAKMEAGGNGQVLTTDAAGDVVWATNIPGGVLTGTTLDGDGTAGNALELADNAVVTAKILDANVTPAKIEAGGNGQVLTTDASGDVAWAVPTAGFVFTNTDRITGDGTSGDPLTIKNDAITAFELANDAVTIPNIADANVTPAKIQPSLTDGQVLTTTGGTVVWSTGGATTLTSSDGSITLNTTGTNYNLSVTEISGGPGGNIATNSISQGDIDFDAIGSGELQGDSVGESELKDDAVTTGKILDGTILDEDINGGINGAKIIPNFGGQNITTIGDINGGSILASGDISATGNLDVVGNVEAGTVSVAGNPVHPDYVFQKYFLGSSELKEDYNFKTLQEIETFIKKHHHLPGIKSAEQVKKDGSWNLSESNLQNLEKIEELYLHTIEQENKINQLQSEKEILSDEVKALRNDLEDIKTMLKKLK